MHEQHHHLRFQPLVAAVLLAIALVAGATAPTTARAAEDTSPMYRLYNRWSGEHLFTTDKAEYDQLAGIGWTREGIAWRTPTTGDEVYRLYNPYSGDHFYTKDADEYDYLGSIGWNQEGLAFHSDESAEGSLPIYRLFNQWLTAGTHLFTTDKAEYDQLVGIGWSGEGVAFYGLKLTDADIAANEELKKDEDFSTPTSASWASDTSYQATLVDKATRHGSDTDWCVTVDCSNCRMSVLHKNAYGVWRFVAGWDCECGPIENGRSISMNWGYLTTIRSKWQHSGNGMDVNPWKISLTEGQTSFGWHGLGKRTLAWRNNLFGTPYNTNGGMAVDNEPAKWMYDTLDIGTKVIVFDNVDPK